MRVLLLLLLLTGCLPPSPSPSPKPGPNPPDPVPVVDTAWLVVLEESSERTPDAAAVIRALPSLGFAFRVYDDDSADAAGYLDAANGVSRPTLLVLDKNGNLLRAVGLPDTVDGLKRLVGEVAQ